MAGQSRGWDLPIHPEGVPLVSTASRAGELLGIPADQLGQAITAAGLRPWGRHACGQPVWRWTELLTVARSLGVQPRPSLTGTSAVAPARSKSGRNEAAATAIAGHACTLREATMARRVGWTQGYRSGNQGRLPVTASLSGMLQSRPARRRSGSTTLRVQRPRRKR
jgi:hypothetical protein